MVNDNYRQGITNFVQSIPEFQECEEEDVETWMACDAEDCGFQMLNDDEIVTSVQEESDPVDYRTDEDEDNTTKVARVHQVLIFVRQGYQVQVYDEFVIRGNTAVLRCQVPSMVRDYVIVTTWEREDGVTIVSNVANAQEQEKLMKYTFPTKSDGNVF
ncbi:uncharacterized protein TNCV_3120061 [Trichonephila clavipes]|uniref:Ig-like domain-containing protein n=1 Tax=Trichonephila clavipes TaxID=2585209 RepID=A0A8X6WAR5_TRICX|nr:uncharacterized protein TNCV_3120061 [Trichonephila clavipes]